MKTIITRGIALLALCAWHASAVWAETVTFHFSGNVTNIDPDNINLIGGSGVVAVVDTISGTVTYDLAASGHVGATEDGQVTRIDYSSPVPPAKLTYTVGSLTFQADFVLVLIGDNYGING